MATSKQIRKDMSRVFTDTDPVTIQAAITDYCFNKCMFCDHFLRDDKKHIDTDTWIDFLYSLKDTKTIFYTGGDSLAHPNINEIMRVHIELDIDFAFITTGFIPSSVDIELLKQASFFNVSLDSIDEHNYENIRGGIELQKVLDSIDYALENDVKVSLTIVISEENSFELKDIASYALMHNLDLRVNLLHGEEEKFEYLAFDDYKELFESNGLTFTIKNKKYEFEKCVVAYYSMFVDSKGDIYPCCILGGDTEKQSNIKPLGNISNFDKAKRNRELFYRSELPDKCSNCLSSFQKINKTFEEYPTINMKIEESRNYY